MSFRTRLDYSSNRQIYQRERTSTVLSATTVFGMPFSALTSGPDPENSGTTSSIINIVSTFSGNTGETQFVFGASNMDIAVSSLDIITPINSGFTQDTGYVFVPNTTTIIDGNTVALSYSGVAFDFLVTGMTETAPGIYTGSGISSEVYYLSANTLDFTGRTIWTDNVGITKTKQLMVTEGAVAGYVLTALNTDGDIGYVPVSTITSGDTFVTGSTLTGGTTLVLTRNDGGNVVQDLSSINSGSTFTGNTSGSCINNLWVSNVYGCSPITIHDEIQYIGSYTNGDYTFAFGYTVSATSIGAHAIGRNTLASGQYSHSEGVQTVASGLGSHAEGNRAVASGTYSHAEGSMTEANGNNSHAEGSNVIANGTSSHAGGDGLDITTNRIVAHGNTSFVHYSQDISSGLIGAYGDNSVILGGKNHNIRIGSTNSVILGGDENIILDNITDTIILGGHNITGITSTMVYVPDLTIDGLTSTDPLATDSTGKIVAGASDARLKQNIKSLEGGLDKIKALRGVSFEWTPESNMGGGIRFGLIAQEVQEVIPEMVRPRSKGDGMLSLSYTEVVPWLIEAVKELSETGLRKDEYILETQTIASEDNNIELNYGGNRETAIGGGIKVLHALGDGKHARLIIDENGRWVTDGLVTGQLTLPEYTPESSADSVGSSGDVVWDDDYLYIKRNNGWGRCRLEDF